ncbi:hypothetical protein BMS_0773 [Halobacteriovorax marinus SJ]|uniref:Helix-turn-helix domain-containing protein n=1 Tax=Halobacteriovorax marinus (strain ATCC BAA-682 / DSM 15412 / SJ) TaxID=862908 RepID=E1X5V9_HALMS|nr:helix-turn-helix domain-containing protein [Halobacteriovorax marinus]CBW25676.1 hypothetical protein BMS_0773 [Halobacteriovorax marinus SJ]
MALKKNFTQIPNEIFQSKTLSLKAIGIYAYLKYKSYCGNGQRLFPSQKGIMKDLKIGSDNTLRKLITELVENDFLTVKKGSIYTGNSQYKLLVPKKCGDNSS